MRRILLAMVVILAACDDSPSDEWSDAPAIEVCEQIVDECGGYCVESAAAGDFTCNPEPYGHNWEIYDICRNDVMDETPLVELVPGLFIRLANDVVMGRKPSCEAAIEYLDAWRYE